MSLHVFDLQNPNSHAPALLVFPALAASSGIYVRMAFSLAKMGYRLVLVDPRGTGESAPPPSRKVDFGIHEHLEYDWPAAIAWTKSRYPSCPIVLLGHSLGGQLSAVYSGQHPGSVKAMILLNVPFVWYRNWPFPSSLALWAVYAGCSLTASVFGYFPANRLGLGQPVAKTLLHDWTHWGLTGKLIDEEGNDLATLLERVSGPVLCISFTDDRFHAPQSAVNDFARRLIGSELTRWHLSPSELEVDKLGHFVYLRSAARLCEKIHEWLDLQLPRSGAMRESSANSVATD